VTIKDLERESQRRVQETDELQKALAQAAAVTGLKLAIDRSLQEGIDL
jgi:hypothetical protein